MTYGSGMHAATFAFGTSGLWAVESVVPVRGDTLPLAARLEVRAGVSAKAEGSSSLRGVAGHARYVERCEKGPLDAASPPLGRPAATCAALIPIRKSDAWWALPHDERRAIFETRSHHIADSMAYLPRVARRLYHCRDLGEPFDFLTWFEFAPADAQAFEELVSLLRSREEWTFVEREVDVRLRR